MKRRSYWLPGASAPTLSEKRNASFRLVPKKGFKEERRTQVAWYAINTCTTLESTKSLWTMCTCPVTPTRLRDICLGHLKQQISGGALPRGSRALLCAPQRHLDGADAGAQGGGGLAPGPRGIALCARMPRYAPGFLRLRRDICSWLFTVRSLHALRGNLCVRREALHVLSHNH